MKITGNIGIHFSRLAVFIIITIYFLQIMNVRYWKVGNGIITWDTISYYAYLPATFIYHDLSLEFIKDDPAFFSDKVWPETLSNGNYAVKTTMGLSLLYSPFFLAGHLYSRLSPGIPANGYSMPYQIALEFSSLFYLITGLLMLRKILLRYFSETITVITLLSVGLATNLFTYTTQHATMPHSFNFTLIVAFMYFTIQWHEKKKVTHAVFLGLLTGLIILVRPTNIAVLLIFLLFDMPSLKERLRTILYYRGQILLMAFLAFAVWIPQLLYWKDISGHWLLFSYGNDERFFWTQPEITKVLFGFRKGWLIYTPVMIAGIAGIFMLRKRAAEWKFAIPVTILVSVYIISSWWCWWYGGGFGMRPMIDYYGLMAVGIAAVLEFITSRKKFIRTGFAIFFSATLLLGVYHHVQYYYGAIHFDSMTWEAYKYSFGKVHDTQALKKYLDPPDYEGSKIKRQ